MPYWRPGQLIFGETTLVSGTKKGLPSILIWLYCLAGSVPGMDFNGQPEAGIANRAIELL